MSKSWHTSPAEWAASGPPFAVSFTTWATRLSPAAALPGTSSNGSTNRRLTGIPSTCRWATCPTGESTKAAFEKVRAEIGNPSILVNNAGITRDGVFRKMSLDDWNAVISTNLNSLFNVTKQVIDGMLDSGWGRIINISSVNGEKGQFGQTNYSTPRTGSTTSRWRWPRKWPARA